MTEPEVEPYASVVIVAAGRGERFGQPAKVLAPVGGRPVLAWSLSAAAAARNVREVVIVAGLHTEADIRVLVKSWRWHVPVTVVPGGERRQDSVAAGVAAVSCQSEVVLVHDGARPLAATALFEACAREARISGAVIVAIPVADTLKRVRDGSVETTVPRAGLWAAQTPQGFRREMIHGAVARGQGMGVEFTDEASLLEALGYPVRIVPGARTNLKVTHPEDLELVDALLRRRSLRMEERGQ